MIQLMSNVKIITSGLVPTTANLLPGQAAFGKMNSDNKYHLFGNTGEGGGAGKVVDIILDTYGGVDAFSLDQVLAQGNKTTLDAIFTDSEGTTKVTIGPSGLVLGSTSVKETEIKVAGKDVFSAALTAVSDDDASTMRGLLKVYSKSEVDGLLAGVYHVKGSVNSFSDLRTDAKVGDVYNIKTAGGKDINNTPIKAGDNVVYVEEGETKGWDVLSGLVDLSAYYTSEQVDNLLKDYAKSADVYTQTAADNKFLTKTDAETTYAKSADVYTKTEIDDTHSTMNTAIQKAQSDATNANTEIGKLDTRVDTLEKAGYQTADDVNTILTDGHYVADENYVHTDNNFTADEKAKVAKIVTDGDGTKVLTDNGAYDSLEISVGAI